MKSKDKYELQTHVKVWLADNARKFNRAPYAAQPDDNIYNFDGINRDLYLEISKDQVELKVKDYFGTGQLLYTIIPKSNPALRAGAADNKLEEFRDWANEAINPRYFLISGHGKKGERHDAISTNYPRGLVTSLETVKLGLLSDDAAELLYG